MAKFPGRKEVQYSSFVIGTKAYIVGGWSLWEYNPTTNTWTQKNNYHGKGAEMISFSINNKGYVGFGSLQTENLNEFYEYDPATDNWTRRSDFPAEPRSLTLAFTIKNKGIIIGGLNYNKQTYYTDLWQNEPEKDTWSRIPS